ncbi:MAG TPA: HAMP domain-containing sensor histidine kinase [Chryseosolibacter sp.]|nr:HAMP domain-containing sensor histidine kinase [Chryseosolibacter sp.]
MVQNTLEPIPNVLLSAAKRNVLLAKICVFCVGLSVLHIVVDTSQGLYDSVAVDFAFGLVIGIAFFLNRWHYHRTSKILVLLLLNAMFILFTSVLPKDVGIYLYYFPLIVVSSALFGSEEQGFRYFFLFLPVMMLCILVNYDFDLLPGVQLKTPLHVDAFFAINTFSSAAVTIMCVNFMQRLNSSSEHELKELAEEINAKNVRLEKTNAELDRFLYSTSHDLRSPLSSIKGLVNIARHETTDEKIQRYFSMMIDRVDKLDSFIKDIIDYSKNARTEIRQEHVDFNSLLAEVTDNLKYLEGAEAIRFETDVRVGSSIIADRNRLSVVLNNLMANAIKYHDPRKDTQWIDVCVTKSERSLKVTVSDNGLGIDPEHQQKIFDMFYRGTVQSKGSGLGLYIVKETISKMKGTIRVESTPGKGSAFLITLPVLS